MKKTMRTVCTMFAAIIAAFIFFGTSINTKAETLPIGEGQALPLNKVITLDKANNYYYTMTLPSSGTLKYHVVSGYGIDAVEISDKDNRSIYSESNGGWFSVKDFSTILRGGQYAVRVRNYHGVTCEVVFYFTPNEESFPETETSNNDTPMTASVIPSIDGTLYKGQVAHGDTCDWYKFTLPSSCDLKIELNSISENRTPTYLIEDVNEDYIADSNGNGTFTHSLEAGTYYLKISNTGYSFTYSMRLRTGLSSDLTSVKVNNVKVKATKKGKLNIKWNKVKNKNVAGYEITVATDRNFYNTIATYDVKKSAKSKKITIPSYYRNRKVYVKVRAFNYPNSNQKNYSKDGKILSIRVKK